MKEITKTPAAVKILTAGGLRWFAAGSHTTRLTRRSDGFFEFRLHRGHDITQTCTTISYQIIEAAKAQGCIAAIGKTDYEKISDRENDQVIVVQFTLEDKEEPKPGKVFRSEAEVEQIKAEDPNAEFGEGNQYLGSMPTVAEASEFEGGRQWIGVYVDNDADAALVLEALKRLKEGGPAVRPFNQDFAGISSLDWDSFSPSSPEDEAWRQK